MRNRLKGIRNHLGPCNSCIIAPPYDLPDGTMVMRYRKPDGNVIEVRLSKELVGNKGEPITSERDRKIKAAIRAQINGE